MHRFFDFLIFGYLLKNIFIMYEANGGLTTALSTLAQRGIRRAK